MAQQKSTQLDKMAIGGIAHMRLAMPTETAHLAVVEGLTGNPDGRTQAPITFTQVGDQTYVEGYRHNLFVNQGLEAALDSMFGDLTAVPITHIALSGDNGAVTATTADIDPSGTGFSPKVTANTSRTNRTAGADNTWTQDDVSFSVRKVGLLTGALKTNVVNIIGGTGNQPFTVDLTSQATFTLTIGIDVTLAAT
jgi:hypothetical protein